MPKGGPRPKQFSQEDAVPGQAIIASEFGSDPDDASPVYGPAVPVGGCIPWMSPVQGSPQPDPPSGWEYADGGAVTTVDSPLFGLIKPGLMATVENPGTPLRMVRGVNTTVAYGGNIALTNVGADTHFHSIGTNNAGGHNHTALATTSTMQTAGAHSHGGRTSFQDPNVAGNTGLGNGELLFTFTDRRFNMFMNSDGGHTHVMNSHFHNTDFQGVHSHGGNTSSLSNIPNSVQMAWIIRVI